MSRPGVSALCFLVCAGVVLGCEWASSDWENQTLSLGLNTPYLGDPTDVDDMEECKVACCKKKDCDLALVGLPQDGRMQCMLVKCWIFGSNQCELQSSTQYKMYRKKQNRGTGSHVVPLLGELGPERNDKTNDNNVHCRLPMKIGKCRAAFRKFYYDVTNQSCQMFFYGGCDANANNFETKEECENTCTGVTGSVLPDESTPAPPQRLVKAARKAPAPSQSEEEDDQPASERGLTDGLKVMSSEDFDELCGVDPAVGPCRAAFSRWYYNSKTASCEMFIFGGCRGNKNNYLTPKLCVDTCTGVAVFSSSKKTDDATAAELKDHCLVSPDPGPCRASFPMFYYNPDSNTCQSFIYGGCRGNGNRYSSMEECMNRCDKDGWFSSTNRTKNHWTAGLFLFITLAAISALLLAAIIIYSLRRRGLSHRTSSISDKQELLPDVDEHSSGDSLSLPESPKLSKA